MKSTPVNIVTLSPLRGIAAILVAIYHFLYAFIISNEGSDIFFKKCYVMVDLFFIMSGFIMMHVYRDIFSEQVTLSAFRKFIVARFARIYPLHLFMLFLFVLMVFGAGHGNRANPIYEPTAIISNLFLVQSFGFHQTGTWNVASWSISAEWWSYMVFPLICLFLIKRRKVALLSLAILVVFLYLLIIFYLPRNEMTTFYPDIDVSYRNGILRGLAGFITGMLSYLLFSCKKVQDFFKSDILSIFLFIMGFVLMECAVFDLFYIPFFILLILAFASNNGRLCKISALNFFQFIGDISYSFYLTHGLIILLIIQVLMRTRYGYKGPAITSVFTGLPYIILFLCLVTGISFLTYTFIEKPARDFINNKFNKRKLQTPMAP